MGRNFPAVGGLFGISQVLSAISGFRLGYNCSKINALQGLFLALAGLQALILLQFIC